MLINFDLGSGPFKSRSAFQGGSWKDKLTAKKAAFYRQEKLSEQSKGASRSAENEEHAPPSRPNADQVDLAHSSDRPEKRQRVSGESNIARYRPPVITKSGKNDGKNSGQNSSAKQVVSSLFSFNPESSSAAEQKSEEEHVPAEPSNAPLQSELDTFMSLGLSSRLAEHLLKKMEIRAPTSIQKEAITQLIKDDTDAFIQAETGSGKTMAYLLPIVQRIANLSSESTKITRDSGLFAIILAPTRELSKQISVVLEKLLRCVHWLVSSTVSGGENKNSEKERIRKGLNILIATPGRLADHLDHTKALDVSNVRWLVLDEGDRLMELGFEKDLQKIVSTLNMRKSPHAPIAAMPEQRTTVLCSATMKMNVQKLGEISLKNAVHIKSASSDEQQLGEAFDDRFSAPAQLQQSFAVVPAKLRLVTLQAVLKRAFGRKGSVTRAIVFMSCADSVDFHFEVFARRKTTDDKDTEEGHPKTGRQTEENSPSRTCAPAHHLSSKQTPVQVFRLHGSLPQAVRTSTLAEYTKSKDPAVLICTDVASRGLDLPNVDFVIEYDPPFNKDDHLHRIGRTARAGNDGRAMIFLMPGSEEGYADVLKVERRDGGRDITRQNSTDILKKTFTPLGVNDRHAWEEHATNWQLDVERWTLDHPPHLEQARRAYQSHIRAYATHVAAERHIFVLSGLHLGHLAKAFALRDKPGSIRVPGQRPSQSSANANTAERRSKARAAGGVQKSVRADGDEQGNTDAREAARKMRSKMKTQLAGASEFNLG